MFLISGIPFEIYGISSKYWQHGPVASTDPVQGSSPERQWGFNTYDLFAQFLLNEMFADSDSDIIDETLQYFKANVFFKNYEIKVLFFLSYLVQVKLFLVTST